MSKYIKITDEEYPDILKRIPEPPQKLYYIGDLSLLKTDHIVAIVGSRKASQYGINIAFNIARDLARKNVVIVSGMAQGIDSTAHRGCLYENGKTIAVLGTGVDKCFPSGNKDLKKAIEEKGLVISEFEDGFSGSKYSFPLRNRIISGLSKVTIIVEAGLKSGALITADIAMNQGKTVYSVPGNINNAFSLGTNKLIQDGAQIFMNVNQVLNDIGIYEIDLSEHLYGDERKIYSVLKNNGEIAIETMVELLKIDRDRLYTAMVNLEMKGIIYSAMGKIFIAK